MTLHDSKRPNQGTIATTLDAALPRLVTAYEQGRLVPFVGAGLSTPACHLWPKFVHALESQVEATDRWAGDETPDGLIMRANRAIRQLRGLGTENLSNGVRSALYANKELPAQTRALCRVWWPIILTTNYDDCLVEAFKQSHLIEMKVCGRRLDDSQYVLNALYEPAEPILWAIQGHLGGPFGKSHAELASEIVVGHEEYSKVAYSEPQFRRAFAEVFRSRTMLFLGSGLKEPYFREMFSEILEIYGPCAQPHYAFVKKDEVDVQFMATRFQIVVVEYDEHEELPEWLNHLADSIETAAVRKDRVSRVLNVTSGSNSRIEIARGRLPTPSGGRECAAVSAGGQGLFSAHSKAIQAYLKDAGVSESPAFHEASRHFVGRFGQMPFYSVRARETGDFRSLRVIGEASEELFGTASKDGFERILMQVLGAGGAKNAASSYNKRPFQPIFSIIESIRAFGRWCRANPNRHLELIIHVVDESIWREISWGRLDIDELLASSDLRFWANIFYPGGRMQRQICLQAYDATFERLARWLGLAPDHWQVEAIPSAGAFIEDPVQPLPALLHQTLSAGVVPGATLRFTCPRIRPENSNPEGSGKLL
jgi:hypothetical protein